MSLFLQLSRNYSIFYQPEFPCFLTLCWMSFFTNRRRLRMGSMEPKYKFWYLSSLWRYQAELFAGCRYQSYLSVGNGNLGNWDHLFGTFASPNQTRWKSYFLFFFKTLAQSIIILEGYRFIWRISFKSCLALILKFFY